MTAKSGTLNADTEVAASRRRRRLGWLRAEHVAATVAVLCYANTLPNDFCYDDHAIVRLNKAVNEPGQWLAIWTTGYWSQREGESLHRDLLYRPVAMTSHRLVRAIAGESPLFPHLVNILLHALISGLVARFCRLMGGNGAAALAAGVVFAVLPIHTEAVAAVVGRVDLLATLGVLLALLAHRRSTMATASSRALWWRSLAAFAAFDAMGAKESGVCVVAMVAVFDPFWLRASRATGGGRRGGGGAGLKRLWYLLIPLTLYLALRAHALDGVLYQEPALTKTVNVLVGADPLQHAMGVVQLWGMYWAKTIWPCVLCVKYTINAIRLATSPSDVHVVIGAGVAIGLVVISAVAWRRGTRSIALLSLATLISYALTANALVLMRVFFAERIWYLPSVFVAVLAGLAIGPLLRRPIPLIIAAMLALCLFGRCWVRQSEWRNDGTLYRAAYDDHPNGVGSGYLYGQWLVANNRFEEGAALLRRVMDIDPGYVRAHRTIGSGYLANGNNQAAVYHLQIANMQVPGHPPTVRSLERARNALLADKRIELEDLIEQADRNPGELEPELALVRKLRELALTDEALARLDKHADRFAGDAAWQIEYAKTCVYLNRLDSAIDRYRRGLKLDPANPSAAVEIAMLLLERRGAGDLDEADGWAAHAARLAPRSPIVLFCRAELLVARGDRAAAGALYREAIGALPQGDPRRRVWQQRAKALGH